MQSASHQKGLPSLKKHERLCIERGVGILPDRQIKWMTLCCLLCGFIWLADGPRLVLAYGPAQEQSPLAKKNVLILHTLSANLPANIKADQALRITLEEAGLGVNQQFFEYLDLARNPGPGHRRQLAELMRTQYDQGNIDLIITLQAGALQFVLKEGRDIFPDVPVLALDLPPNFEAPQTDRHIIRQFVAYDMAGTLEEALKLVPGAKRVYVVIGAHPEHKPYIDQARRDFRKWERRLEFIYLNDRSFEEMLAMVSNAPSGTIVFYMVLVTDVTGKSYTPRDALQRLSRASKAPVFGLYDTLLGYGIVGGSLVSFEHLGVQAARLALQILSNPQSLKTSKAVLEVPHVSMFDWRQLRHWHLSEDALPEGRIVINRESTFWDFKYYIIGALAFLLAQSFLIAGLMINRRYRRSAEESLRQKREELDNFFNMTLDLLCIAGTDGYFLLLNPAWEKTFGYSLKELMSRRFLEFVHPEDVAATRDAIQSLASQKQVIDFANRYRHRNGTYRHLLWSATSVDNRIYAAAKDITERLQAEAAIHEREQELQTLTDRLILGQEEERRRLARELHDDLSQRLAVLAIETGNLQSAVQDGNGSILTPLLHIRDKTIQIAADVHNISRRLHPSILDDLGLSKALEAECRQFSTREGIGINFSVGSIPADLPKEVSLSIYRIIQEGLNNIAKHACANHVTVSLNTYETGLHLIVADDGIGFDVAGVSGKPGLGLSSIRERVRLVNGKHRIISEPDKGVTIKVTVPLKSEPLNEAPAAISQRIT